MLCTSSGTPQARRAAPHAKLSMSRDEITSIVTALSDLLTVLRNADAADKAEIYAQLGLRLTYAPVGRVVRTEMRVVSPAQYCKFESVRGANAPINQ